MKSNLFLLIFIVFTAIPLFGDEVEDIFTDILGHWYDYENIYFDFEDTSNYLHITKSNDLYTLTHKYTTSEGSFIYTVTGTVTRGYVNEANKKYFMDYNIHTDKGIYYLQIQYKHHNRDYKLYGNDIIMCCFIPLGCPDYFLFSKKEEVIRVSIPNLNVPRKLQGPLLIGYINDSEVRLRDNHGLQGKIIRKLNKNEKVEVKGVSSAFEAIDGNYEFWYQVMTQDGMIGWVYGLYLGITGFDRSYDGGG